MKKLISSILCFAFIFLPKNAIAESPDLEINAKSALLMEASTGKVIYELNSHEKLPPASVTKIMTMLLVMEAVDSGKIKFDDMVTASARAKSMGGSTIFLDEGERMSVYDLLKGVAVASGNDASVALAEFVAGSESEFVNMMNKRASELGMNDTSFMNTNGLDTENHYTSANDIALMSRELLKHDKIFEFTTIWTDSLRDGAFDLANTNKLIRFYDGANGLKTGSTSTALYCLSGTAKRDGMQLIAVIMGAPTSADRFDSCKALLDYGFANYSLVKPANAEDIIGTAKINKGKSDTVELVCSSEFNVLLPKSELSGIECKTEITDGLNAPVKKGDVAGKASFFLGEKLIGEVPLVAAQDVPAKSFGANLLELLQKWF